MITTDEASIQHYRVIGRQLIVTFMFYVGFVATALPIALLVPWPPIKLPTNTNEFDVRSLASWACVLGAALGLVLPLLSCVHVALWVEKVCSHFSDELGPTHAHKMHTRDPTTHDTSLDRVLGPSYIHVAHDSFARRLFSAS